MFPADINVSRRQLCLQQIFMSPGDLYVFSRYQCIQEIIMFPADIYVSRRSLPLQQILTSPGDHYVSRRYLCLQEIILSPEIRTKLLLLFFTVWFTTQGHRVTVHNAGPIHTHTVPIRKSGATQQTGRYDRDTARFPLAKVTQISQGKITHGTQKYTTGASHEIRLEPLDQGTRHKKQTTKIPHAPEH